MHTHTHTHTPWNVFGTLWGNNSAFSYQVTRKLEERKQSTKVIDTCFFVLVYLIEAEIVRVLPAINQTQVKALFKVKPAAW